MNNTQSEENPMKNAEKIYNIGQWIMILGSVIFAVDLSYDMLRHQSLHLTLPIAIVYIVSIVLMLIGWFGSRDARRARKEQQKREADAARQSA